MAFKILQPSRWHPRLQMRAKGLLTGRRIVEGCRVRFPCPNAACLERHFYLGPGSGEVLVQNHSSLVSPGTERAVFVDAPNAYGSFPFAPGYSAAGQIVAVGPNVSGFKVGDRVVTSLSHSDGGVIRVSRVNKIPTKPRVFTRWP
jgi:NADPH-dependent curcumin reductase CurA